MGCIPLACVDKGGFRIMVVHFINRVYSIKPYNTLWPRLLERIGQLTGFASLANTKDISVALDSLFQQYHVLVDP